MNATHTPGPWCVSTDKDGDLIAEVYGMHRGSPLHRFSIISETHRVTTTNADSDARLIAAAPELFEALLAAVKRVEIANNEGDPILSAWLPDARKAIAKATGGS